MDHIKQACEMTGTRFMFVHHRLNIDASDIVVTDDEQTIPVQVTGLEEMQWGSQLYALIAGRIMGLKW